MLTIADEFIVKMLNMYLNNSEYDTLNMQDVEMWIDRINERVHELGVEGIVMHLIETKRLRGVYEEDIPFYCMMRDLRCERQERLFKKLIAFLQDLKMRDIKCVVGGPFAVNEKLFALGHSKIDQVVLHLSEDVDVSPLSEKHFMVRKIIEDQNFFKREYFKLERISWASNVTLYKEYKYLHIDNDKLSQRLFELYTVYLELCRFRREYEAYANLKLDDKHIRTVFGDIR